MSKRWVPHKSEEKKQRKTTKLLTWYGMDFYFIIVCVLDYK